MRSIFEVGSTLGWRYREIIDLRVRQVDLSAGTLRMRGLHAASSLSEPQGR
jgi:hypothetical protein